MSNKKHRRLPIEIKYSLPKCPVGDFRNESSELLHGEPLQCVSSFKVCSRCGGSGVIKKEEEAPEEDREKE